MDHRPVCVRCQVELRCETSGIKLLDMAAFGPYKLWSADLYKCPKCGYELVTGFGSGPLAEHYEKDFANFLQGCEDRGLVIKNLT